MTPTSLLLLVVGLATGLVLWALVSLRIHDIGAILPEGFGIALPVDANHQPETAITTSLHAGDRILHDHRTLGCDAELFPCFEKGVRRWLPWQFLPVLRSRSSLRSQQFPA